MRHPSDKAVPPIDAVGSWQVYVNSPHYLHGHQCEVIHRQLSSYEGDLPRKLMVISLLNVHKAIHDCTYLSGRTSLTRALTPALWVSDLCAGLDSHIMDLLCAGHTQLAHKELKGCIHMLLHM